MGSTHVLRWGVLGLVVMLAVAGIAPSADAVVGGTLLTVNIPSAAQCGGSSGSAVAVVPGGKLNFPKFHSLLVTSCIQSGQVKLFFLDPSTDPAALVSTLNTILPTGVTLDAGWESLALRSDKVDLIGCGMVGGTPKVYSIDFNQITPNTTVDGTATLLFTGPAGSTCQGLAWDVTSNPKTIYQSSSGASPNVLHLSDAGASIAGSVPSGCAGPMTGVAVGVVSAETPAFSGSVLFVACPADDFTPEIRQIKRADGALVTSVEVPTGSFALPTDQPGDIECDPVTFAVSQSWHPTIRNKDVLWVKDTDPLNPHQVHAMELPFAACGPVAPPPTPAVNACPTGDQDTDGDGLPDCWEDGTYWADSLPGIALDGKYIGGRADTSQRFTLCVDTNGVNGFEPALGECATPLNRDIFAEIDYMEFHRPNPQAVSDVVAAFSTAPAFAAGSGKCDGAGCTPGVRLHVQVDEQISHVNNTALFPCTGPKGVSDADFDTTKTAKVRDHYRPRLRQRAQREASCLPLRALRPQPVSDPARDHQLVFGVRRAVRQRLHGVDGELDATEPRDRRSHRRRGEPIRAGGDLHARARAQPGPAPRRRRQRQLQAAPRERDELRVPVPQLRPRPSAELLAVARSGGAAHVQHREPPGSAARPQRGLSCRVARRGDQLHRQDRLRPAGGSPGQADRRGGVAQCPGDQLEQGLGLDRHEHFSRPHRHDQHRRRLPGVKHQGVPRGLRRLGAPPAQPAGLDGLRRRRHRELRSVPGQRHPGHHGGVRARAERRPHRHQEEDHQRASARRPSRCRSSVERVWMPRPSIRSA